MRRGPTRSRRRRVDGCLHPDATPIYAGDSRGTAGPANTTAGSTPVALGEVSYPKMTQHRVQARARRALAMYGVGHIWLISLRRRTEYTGLGIELEIA